MRLAHALAIAFMSTTAIAQAPTSAPGSRNPAAVTGGTYTADPGHTLVVWTVDHLGFSSSNGFFADPTDKLTGDPARPASARLVSDIPLSKVVTISSALDKHPRNADFFDVERFPSPALFPPGSSRASKRRG